MKIHANFASAIRAARESLGQFGVPVKAPYWQGVNIEQKPEMRMHEILNLSFQVVLGGRTDLDYWRQDIKPNLPWADQHFEQERVSGQPINPGETWKTWPYGHSANSFLDSQGQFNHSYAERYWPQYAGATQGGHLSSDASDFFEPHQGIRHRYADLDDLVHHLTKDPLSRQAYLPVWFPEDGSHNDRKPCSLGYHFIMRNGYFHCTYYIRACDYVRHFRDDLYLTLRLQLWILDQLRKSNPEVWNQVNPGLFSFHCVSFHCFVNDLKVINEEIKSDLATPVSGQR